MCSIFPEFLRSDEKNLQQLSQLIEKRISEQCPNRSVGYQVRFVDGYSYVTSSLDSILQENNREPRKIESIEIRTPLSRSCRKDYGDRSSDASIHLQLSRNNYLSGINSVVEGHQRDWVDHTASDIAQQLNGMTLTYLVPKWVWMIVLLPASCIALAWLLFVGLQKAINKGIKNKDPNASPLTKGQLMELLGPGMSTLGLFPLAGAFLMYYALNCLFPSAVFLIGKEIEDNTFIGQVRFSLGMLIIGLIVTALLKRFYQFCIAPQAHK